MIEKTYNIGTNIFEVTYNGDISISDMIKHLESSALDKTLPRTLKIITDHSQSNITFKMVDIPDLVKYLTELLKNFTFIKQAIVLNRPYPAAILSILKLKMKDITNYEFEFFLTKEEAIAYLQS